MASASTAGLSGPSGLSGAAVTAAVTAGVGGVGGAVDAGVASVVFFSGSAWENPPIWETDGYGENEHMITLERKSNKNEFVFPQLLSNINSK